MHRKLFAVLCLVSLLSTLVLLPAQANYETKRDQSRQQAFTPKVAKRAIDYYLKAYRLKQIEAYRNFQNVIEFEVKDVKELPLDFVKTLRDVSHYETTGTPFKFVYAAIHFKVKQENKYLLNGINYRLVGLIQKRGKWEVDHKSQGAFRYAEYHMVPVHQVVEKNLGFGTSDEKEMAEIMRKHFQGIYVNRRGENIADRGMDNIATEDQLIKEVTGAAGTTPSSVSEIIPATINPSYKRPQYIRVLMTKDENKKYYGCAGVQQCIRRVDFLEYCKHVLPIEWSPSDPDESLKAGAMAVKLYAWYKVTVDPTANTGDADISDTEMRDNEYLADLSKRFSTPEDKRKLEKMQNMFHSPGVAGVGFKESKKHNLFFFEFKKYDKPKAGGIVSQKGSVKLAKAPHKMNYLEILKYYLEKSPNANKANLDFFRYAK
jgi:hypothetical protein